jgi:antibiotic biosynthesis monooxygenase (ABM) superfamily enzyme
MAPIIWLGIVPIALLSATILRPPLLALPLLPRVFVSAALQVALLTWVVLPLLTRVTARWLYR